MQFLCSIWKILHLTEYFYTGTAHGARNNYQVCWGAACVQKDNYLQTLKQHDLLKNLGSMQSREGLCVPPGFLQ